MSLGLAVLLLLHAAAHVAGFLGVRVFFGSPGRDVPRARRALSLVCGLGFAASALLLFVDRFVDGRHWWIAAAPAVLLSQALLIADFDLKGAKLGTLANAIILVPLTLSLLDLRSSSLRSQYEAEVRLASARVAHADVASPILEADLAPLPPVVQRYLRRAGVVGKPHVRSVHAVFRARVRMKADARWMSAAVDQYNFFAPGAPARLFLMEASSSGLPFVGFHRYVGDAATLRVRLAGLFSVVDAHGPRMTQGETVTMLNDMCFLAPATLVDAPVRWSVVDDHVVTATFSNAGKTVSAELTFDAAGDLVGFVSRDRYQSDGATYHLFPWSTPLGDHRDYGVARLPGYGEARWREPTGEWTYGELWLEHISYNVTDGS